MRAVCSKTQVCIAKSDACEFLSSFLVLVHVVCADNARNAGSALSNTHNCSECAPQIRSQHAHSINEVLQYVVCRDAFGMVRNFTVEQCRPLRLLVAGFCLSFIADVNQQGKQNDLI
eukprot:1959-Heterococcus_DN1.PRE.5